MGDGQGGFRYYGSPYASDLWKAVGQEPSQLAQALIVAGADASSVAQHVPPSVHTLLLVTPDELARHGITSLSVVACYHDEIMAAILITGANSNQKSISKSECKKTILEITKDTRA